MKILSRIILLAAGALLPATLPARVIEKPDYECRLSPVLTVERIELTDTATRVDLLLTAPEGYKGKVEKNTLLILGDTRAKIAPTRAQGATLGKSIKTGPDGTVRYSIFYPPLPASATTVDLVEGGWDILGIRLDGRKARHPRRVAPSRTRPAQKASPASVTPLLIPGKVKVSGVIDSYDPRVSGTSIPVYSSDLAIGGTGIATIDIRPDGTFSDSISIAGPGTAMLHIKGAPSFDFYAQPGENLDIYYDPEVYACAMPLGLPTDSAFRFGGSLGTVADIMLHAPAQPVVRTDKMASSSRPASRIHADIDSIADSYAARMETYISSRPVADPLAISLLRNSAKAFRLQTHLDYKTRTRYRGNPAEAPARDPQADSISLAMYRRSLIPVLAADSTLLMTSDSWALLNRLAFCDLPDILGFTHDRVIESNPVPPLSPHRILSTKILTADMRADMMTEFVGTDTVPILLQLTSASFLTSYTRPEAKGTRAGALAMLDSLRSVVNPRVRARIVDFYSHLYDTTPVELPSTPAGELMKSLLDPHKGKAVIVDFWTVGCGPCRAEIKSWKAHRDAHRGNPGYVFMFITDESQSPLEAYNRLLQTDLKDDISHRIPDEDFNRLKELFNFNAYPHHVVITPDGKVASDDFHLSDRNLATILSDLGIEM